jgi:hypothetical protein
LREFPARTLGERQPLRHIHYPASPTHAHKQTRETRNFQVASFFGSSIIGASRALGGFLYKVTVRVRQVDRWSSGFATANSKKKKKKRKKERIKQAMRASTTDRHLDEG